LIAERSYLCNNAGQWNFFGGKIEPNETPEVAAIRELKEEASIEIGLNNITHIKSVEHQGRSLNYYYYSTTKEIEPKIDSSHIRWGWLSLKVIKELDLHKSVKLIIHELEESFNLEFERKSDFQEERIFPKGNTQYD
jgi:8-oxo-dGTP pyrophosphatase MutT (NUDIX family)